MSEVTDATLQAFLNLFRNNPQGLRPPTIAERAEIDPDLLPAVRERLERDGFSFDEDEEERWILKDKPDRLYPYWIRAGLRCDRLASQVYYRDEVTSTQDVAFELTAEGRPHGTLVLAEHQTGGRGQKNRTWHSDPNKSLLLSLLLDLEPPDTFASVLTIATATATARAIQDVAGLPARIKFPNDIVLRGKKVAGILLEVRDYGQPSRRAVAGVGINVGQTREDFPDELQDTATSLRMELKGNEPPRRSMLLRMFLRELEKWLDRIARDEYADLENAWNRFSAMEGKEVEFLRGVEEVKGRILDARIREGLLLRLPTGEERRFRLEHLTDLRFL